METALTVGIISGAVALISAIGTIATSLYSLTNNNRNSQAIKAIEERVNRSKEVAKYSEPLLRSAYDLQSRIFNIVNQGALDYYREMPGTRHYEYFINNTLFLLCQYFCWTEIARRQIRFIDLGEDKNTRRLQHLQDDLFNAFGSDELEDGLMIFAGEQRAIGEILIASDEQGPICMGYGRFLVEFKPGAHLLLDELRNEISSMTHDNMPVERLSKIQNILVDIVCLLDSDYIRFPKSRISKI